MWLAEHCDDILHAAQNVTIHHPTHLRTACREAGYPRAGETQHQKQRKAQSVRG